MRKACVSSLRRVYRAGLALTCFAIAALTPEALIAAIPKAWQAEEKPEPSWREPEPVLRFAQASDPEDTEESNPYGVMGIVQDWLARANREYQGIIIRELSLPSSGETPEDAIAKTRDAELAAAARKAAEAKAAAARKASGASRLAEDQRRAEATKRLADEAKQKADEIARAISEAEPKPQAEAEAAANAAAQAARIEDQRREAEKLAQESRRQQEAEKNREARRAEEQREKAEAEDAKRHRKRTIVLIAEPIEHAAIMDRPRRIAASPVAELSTGSTDAGMRRLRIYRERKSADRQARRRAEGKARCRGAGRAIRLPGRYTVARGDSLWSISRRFYHNGKRWRRIFRANRRLIRNPAEIYPCQRLFVPRR